MMILRWLTKACPLCVFLFWFTTPSEAQLRIVDYNTTGGPRPGLGTVLQAIGQQLVNGFAKPIDVLALQEQSSSATTTQAIVDVLNGLYGSGTYARATVDAGTNGGGRPGLIYNTTTIQLVGQTTFGTLSTTAQARQTARYQVRPIGYDSSADFYVYSNHYKAGTSDTDLDRRAIEATTLRSNLDGLGDGTSAILAGDYNIQSSTEASYQTLLLPGPGQAFDPVNRPGTWHDSSSFRLVHTQAPAVDPPDGLVGGGMDDRFDFQLVTGELLDGEGLDYIAGSYRAFGNNGTHSLNGNISTGSGASNTILSALMTASDHLPVVADYQLPAVLDVSAASIPATLMLGQPFQLQVAVRNAANVVVPIGADDLSYSLMTSGDLSGVFDGVDEALGGSNSHLVTFDTSSVGLKSGTITIFSPSQSVARGLVQIPVSFQVVSQMLHGDYNGDGTVDAADYIVWRKNDGTQEDYNAWRANFGRTAGAGSLSHLTVPEPADWILLVFGAVVRRWRRHRNGDFASAHY